VRNYLQNDACHLRDFADEAGYTVIRDGRFVQLGFLNHHGSGLLVPLYEKSMVDRLESLGDRVAAVLTTRAIAAAIKDEKGLVVAESPIDAFWRLHLAIGRRLDHERPLQPSVIAATARVHPRASVDAMGVEIGAGTTIGPNASIAGRVIIGSDAIIGPNVVIGSDGYQVTRFDGNIVNMRHLGGVWLGDRVEIQAGTIIDRSLWPGFTEIGDDTKVGGSAHVAHCTTVGRRCRLMNKAVICGSVRIGDDAVVGVGAIVSNGISIGSGANVMMAEVARRDVPEDIVQLQGRFHEQRKFARMKALSG
jgi:UDP-3-O-[3-hydroxymyristoyl] glucosamine N-acyltransferase